jgi:hypothetical protein
LGDVWTVNEVKPSEIAHCVYQALSRGSCRTSIEGEAALMKAWIIHPEATLEDDIKTAMPGVRWTEWAPRFLKGVGGRKTRTMVKAITDYLNALPDTVLKVSGKALKVAVSHDATEAVWRDATAFLSERLTGWTREGRSFVRITDPAV